MRIFVTTIAALVVAAGPAMAQKAGGTLRVSHRDNPPSASIHEEATISTVMPFMSVYNNLVVFDPDSKQNRPDRIVPDLATSWTWGNDGKDLTFKLREGVKWHDGKPFTSADVKCTWDMLTAKDSKLRKNPRRSWYFNLEGVTTNGDYEVTFHLGRPQPSLLTMLAGGMSPVYPCHVSAAQMRTHPIGTGPFKFADKPLRIKVSTRNIPAYRDQAVLLIDHLKHVNIQGELEPLETAVWYNRMAKKDYTVGLNVQGVGIDDPDVVFYETFHCGSQRNYTNYCNPETEKLFEQQSRMTDIEARKKLVWEIDKKLQEDGARPVIQHDWGATCWRPEVKGVKLAVNTIYNHWRFEDVWLDR